MREIPSSWFGDWGGLRVAVFGLGKTGFSVADTLIELGVQVRVFARSAEPELLDLLDVIGGTFTQNEGHEAIALLEEFQPDLVITSPGFSPRHPLIEWSEKSGRKVWTDIDLAWNLRDARGKVQNWILVTGTNGKTTVTELTSALLVEAGYRATSCGNIGVPILDVIRDPVGYEWLVVEISSFQLHYLEDCVPESTALLNVENDHLDWHGDFDSYAAAKAKVYRNTKNAAIYNKADVTTVRLLEEANVTEGCRAIGFTLAVPSRSEVGYVEDLLVDRAFLEERADTAREIISVNELEGIVALAPHVLANLAAATALALSVGVSPAQARATLQRFRLAPHRIELVRVRRGVNWVNDSKATNAHAADAALSSFDSVVWIVGGLFKGVDPAPLIERHSKRIKALVVIGADQEGLKDLLETLVPNLPVHYVPPTSNVMQDAVAAADLFGSSGDTVLLAPAAASMDQFKDYADRGNKFADAVKGLSE